jgi:hypothetical protein
VCTCRRRDGLESLDIPDRLPARIRGKETDVTPPDAARLLQARWRFRLFPGDERVLCVWKQPVRSGERRFLGGSRPRR